MVRALAWRSVSARKGRALLNGLGIVLGVALFFSVLSLSQTIVSTFDDLFSSVYGNTDLAISAGANGQGTLPESLLGQVQQVKGVEAAVPTITSTMAIVRKGKSGGGPKDTVYVAGVRPDDPDLGGGKTVAGSSEIIGDQLQLDANWADVNNIRVGDSVHFATSTGIHSFKISGLFQLGSGVKFGGQGFASMDLEYARKYLDVLRGYPEIDVKVKSGVNVSTVKREIEAIVPESVQVNTPSGIANQINSQLQGFNVMLYFFAAMSLFVGGFLILNSFNMTVAQRLREIGLLRTLGASRRLIRRMILLEALILGVIGALVGLAIGLLLTKLMVWLVSNVGFPVGAVKYPPAAFIVAPLLGVIATVLGALRPAVRASRIPPIQAVLVEHRSQPLQLGRRLSVGSVLVVLGLLGVFTLAAASDTPPPIIVAGILGVIFLFTGVIMIGPVVVPLLVRSLAWPLRRLTPVEGRIATDNARANPTRTASTASGLMIGVALIAAIGTIGSSFIGTISDDLDKELRTDFTVQSKSQGGGPQSGISESALTRIRQLPETGVATGVKVYYDSGGPMGQSSYAIDPAVHAKFSVPNYSAGAVPDVNAALEAGQVTIPATMAQSENKKVGDTIRLVGARSSKRLKIAGVVEGNSAEASSVVMSIDTFDSLYGVNDYSQILVIAKTPADRAQLGRQLDTLLAANYPTFESLSNEQVKQQLKNQVNQIFAIFYVIMAVAIFVSLLGVVNTLLMSVLERTREIGLLRAIGTSRWQIRRMIVAESMLITTAGAALGLVVGMALGWAFVRGIASGATNADFHPPVAVIVAVAILSAIAGMLAALPPARRAAKMNVIDALSYE